MNVKGTYLVAKYFAQSLAGKTGTLVNISSSSALHTSPYQSAYGVSKLAALRMLETFHLGELEAPQSLYTALTLRRITQHPLLQLASRRGRYTDGTDHEPKGRYGDELEVDRPYLDWWHNPVAHDVSGRVSARALAVCQLES